MTSVNLGRIGFVNKGDFTDGEHKLNDVVKFNGKIYACLMAHTSTSGDITPNNTTYWQFWVENGADGDSAVLINKPTIISPINGATDTDVAITIEGSVYATVESYSGEHTESVAIFATDIDFVNIIPTTSTGLENIAVNGIPASTLVYGKIQYKSGDFAGEFSETVYFTTKDAGITTPTITTPSNNETDLGKNVEIITDTYTTFGHTEPQVSASYRIYKDAGLSILQEENLLDTTNLTSWTSGDLEVSTDYWIVASKQSASYDSGFGSAVKITTKSQFTPTAGTCGKKGWGIAPTDQPFAAMGLAEMTGTNIEGHDNYGNYIHTNGSIVCWHPVSFMRVGSPLSPRYATYGANAIDAVGTETFANEAEANTGGYFLPRAFINNGIEQGFFMDKYMNSKDGTTAGKSVFGGNPISLTTSSSYNKSSDMTGCTGILADAVVLSKGRGARWNVATAFMYGYKFLASIAHGQACTDVADCAWYDATDTTNYPKGCNDGALGDTDDATVAYTASPDTAAKPLTGATTNFNKTTCNGCANGVADLNGGMYEMTIGITAAGTSATSTTAIANDNIYVLKTSTDHADLTGGWDGTNDAWGNTTHLATLFDAVVSPHALGSSTGAVYWGNGANALFSNDQTGANRDICGFIPKDNSSTDATGTNMAGNDYFYRQNRHNLAPLASGRWNNASLAGLGYRSFDDYRSSGSLSCSFRAAAYVS